ncbi:MAG: hypothetical protein ACRBBQ_03240 [Cognatishimia sp.]
MEKFTTLTTMLFLLAVAGTQVNAQNQRACAPRESVVQRLATGYGETRRSIGLGNNNAMVEVFASDESGSWTITVTMPNGVTCLVATGQSYEALAETLPLQEKDA